MLKKRIKWKWTILGGLAIGCLLGINTVPKTVYAATLQPSATLTINNGGTTEFSTTLDTNNGTKSALIAVPVKVEVEQTDKYSMGIYLDCTDAPSGCNTGNLGALTDSNLVSVGSGSGGGNGGSGSSITTKIASTTDTIQFGNIATNHWGFWYLNDTTTPTVEGSTGTYVLPVPTTTTGTNTIPETAISNVIPETSAGSTGTTTINGQLVFGTKADSTLASGSYSGKVVVTLTATPQEVAEGTFAGINNMQEMTPAICAAVDKDDPVASQGTLVDTRDGKSYLVGKLADGRCWMLQNLAINTGITLKPDDSDVSSDYPIPATVGWSSDTVAYAKNGNHQNNTPDTAVTSNNTLTSNTGNYYSFLTATAGTGTGSSGNASSSICPKGWKLPTGGSGGQFETLYNKYGNASSFNTAFKQAATGSCDVGHCPDAYSYAYYWSSTITIDDASFGYYLYAGGSNVKTALGNYKRNGHSVRCIADIPPLKSGDTMQSATEASCAAMNIGDTINMVDSRDSKSYIVGRLADGNCWMLQNLALEGGKTIYSTDSDITASSYTLPTTTPVGTGNDSSYWNSDTNAAGWMYNGNHINSGSLNASDIATIKDAAPTNNTNPSPTVSTGAYYSYMVATAETGTSNTKYDKAPSSICPKNWHLPTGGPKTDGNGEFRTLYDAYSSDSRGQAKAFNDDFRVAATGYCTTNICPRDGYAAYWSSTIYGQNSNGNYLGCALHSISDREVYPANDGNKRYGYSVRCMLTAAS